jgi:hypothetical protein
MERRHAVKPDVLVVLVEQVLRVQTERQVALRREAPVDVNQLTAAEFAIRRLRSSGSSHSGRSVQKDTGRGRVSIAQR